MQFLRRRMRLVAGVTVLALGLAACGGDDEDTAATDTTTETTTDTDTEADTEVATDAEATDADTETHSGDDMQAAGDPFMALKLAANHVGNSGSAAALAGGIAAATGMSGDVNSTAAQTYATLSTLLQEHVYLAGIAVDAGLSFGLDSDTFNAAAAALDENSVELADVVGSVAPDQRDAFLELWRQHIGFFVDYAAAGAGNDEAGKQQALENLDGYRTQAGAFFEQISGGEIPASAVEESLKGHIQTLTQAIDAAAAGDTSVFSELKEAATHVGESGSAKALAGGIAAATGMDGDVNSEAAATLATLSTLLEEHVYLAGIAVKTAFANGLDSEAFAAAAETLDTNSVDLADVVGSVAPDQREAFLELWRQHIGFFVDYAKGVATSDDSVKQEALSNLDNYRTQAGAFFESISGGEIPASAVEESLKGHIQTLSGAIDALGAALLQG